MHDVIDSEESPMRHHVAWMLAMRVAGWKEMGRPGAVRVALGWTLTKGHCRGVREGGCGGREVERGRGWGCRVNRAGASSPEGRLNEIRGNRRNTVDDKLVLATPTEGGAGERDDGTRLGMGRGSAVVWFIDDGGWRCAKQRCPR